MGLVLWIDENALSASLVERVFKRRGLAFYSLTKIDHFSYLIDDLRPALIVLDGATFAAHRELIVSQYQASEFMQQVPMVLLAPQENMDWIKNKMGTIPKPFDPFEIPQIITRILGTN